MKKKKTLLQQLLNVCISLFVVFALALAVFPSALIAHKGQVFVYADGETETENSTETGEASKSQEEMDALEVYDRSDANGIWEFEKGAAVSKAIDSSTNEYAGVGLRFSAWLKDPDYYKGYLNGKNDKMHTYFTVYVENEKGSIPIYEYHFLSTSSSKNVTTLGFYRSMQFESFESETTVDLYTSYFSGDIILRKEADADNKIFKSYSSTVQKHYDGILDFVCVSSLTQESQHLHFKDEYVPYPTIHILLKPNGFKTAYSIGLNYEYKDWAKQKTGWFKPVDVYNDKVKGECRSSIRAQYTVLNNMYKAGVLEEEFGEEGALSVLNTLKACESPETITLKYLVQISGTKFARRTAKQISVPVLNGKIFYDDVISALGVNTLSCLNSYFDDFYYDENQQCYIVKYLKGVYLTARTSDGNTTDAGSESGSKYFLDINQSYYEYFHEKMVVNGIFTNDVYDYFLNVIKQTYPVLEGVPAKELHGYFGYIVIPSAHTLNSLWVDLFNTKTSTVGSITHFSFDNNLTSAGHKKLLDEFQYNWLEKAWSGFIGGVTGEYPATHYIFYTDADEARVGILENGVTNLDDDDSAAMEDIQNVTVELVEGIGNVVESLSGKFNDMKKTIGIVFGVVAGVGLIGAGVFVYLKFIKKKET